MCRTFVVGRWSLAKSLASAVLSQRQTTTDQRRLLCCCLHFLCRFQDFLDRAFHVERLLGDVVVLAFHDRLETLYRVGDLDVLSLRSRELLGHVERLRQEALNLAGSGDGQL